MPSLSHLRTSLVIPPAFIHATPGLALGCAIATSALWLAQQPWFARHGLGALTLAIVAINGWNRLSIAFRTPAGTYQPQHHS